MGDAGHHIGKPGRMIMAHLPQGADLLRAVETLCENAGIRAATFALIGAVTSATIGFYDQKQQVYATEKIETPMEIVACSGNVSLKEGKVFAHAHAVLTDERGQAAGGHLFSETIVFAAEIHLQEVDGVELTRMKDSATGLMLWRKTS